MEAQCTGRAALDHGNRQRTHLGIVGGGDILRQRRAARSTESGIHAQRGILADNEAGAAPESCLAARRYTGIRAFSPVKAALAMGPVAEGLVARLPTTAEGILTFGRFKRRLFLPRQRLAEFRD